MINGLIFEANIFSLMIIKSYFEKAKVNISGGFHEETTVIEIIQEEEPNYIVINYNLYKDYACDIISKAKEIVPESKIIIVSEKIDRSTKNQLKKYGVDFVMEKPFIDSDFIRALRTLNYN